MSKRVTGLIVVGAGGKVDNDMATKNFDSREFTFKYIDRSKYNGGVYTMNADGVASFPTPNMLIPHNLGYVPSYRFYVYSRDSFNDYARNGYLPELTQVNGSASTVNLMGYMGKNNFYITIRSLARPVAGSTIYFVLLIGADNLEKDADEVRSVS